MGEYDPYMFSNVPDKLKSPSARTLREKDLNDQTCRVNLDEGKRVSSGGLMKGIPPYTPKRGKGRSNKPPAKVEQQKKSYKKTPIVKQSDSETVGQNGACDNRRWYKVKTAKHGTCEDITSTNSCNDGVFVKNYCRNKADNVRCCIRVKCLNGAGVCTKSGNCRGHKHKFLAGHCPGPSSVKCCVKSK